jgi:hypothetical protein
MCIFRNIQHASAKGKGTDEDKTAVMAPSANLAVHLYPDLLKSIQQTANCKSATPWCCYQGLRW